MYCILFLHNRCWTQHRLDSPYSLYSILFISSPSFSYYMEILYLIFSLSLSSPQVRVGSPGLDNDNIEIQYFLLLPCKSLFLSSTIFSILYSHSIISTKPSIPPLPLLIHVLYNTSFYTRRRRNFPLIFSLLLLMLWGLHASSHSSTVLL